MLKDSISEKTIELNVAATTWEEAVEKGALLLKNEGVITEKYIENIFENIDENGPYIVIAPGVALPHARADEGVNENGVSILTLADPVEFGHPENDPVQTVITLAANEPEKHLENIQGIVSLLGDDDFLALLKDTDSSTEVYEYIKKLN